MLKDKFKILKLIIQILNLNLIVIREGLHQNKILKNIMKSQMIKKLINMLKLFVKKCKFNL